MVYASRYASNKLLILAIIFIAVTSLLAVANWFRGDFSIVYLDTVFIPNRFLTFYRSLYTWNGNLDICLGSADPSVLAGIFPFEIFRALSEIAGLSPIIAEKVFYTICLFSTGFSMYLLSSQFNNSKKTLSSFLANIFSSIFYMANMYSFIFVWSNITLFVFFYAFLPLKLALFTKWVRTGEIKYVVLLLLIWVLTSNSAYVNPVYAILDWTSLIFFSIFFLFVSKNASERINVIRFSIKLFVLWFLFNAYWLLPSIYFAKEKLSVSSLTFIGFQDDFIYRLNSAPLIDSMRLTGFWALHTPTVWSDPYFTWASAYFKFPLFLVSFSIPLLAFGALLIRPKNRNVIFFAIIAIFGLSGIKGVYPPFGDFTFWLLNATGLLRFFRAPYQRFGIFVVLGYSLLLGYTIGQLTGNFITSNMSKNVVEKLYFKRKVYASIRTILSLSLVFLIIGIYAWPFWTGDIIYSGGKVFPSARVIYPEYYYEASEWMNAQKDDFRILLVPFSKLGYKALKWNNGNQGYYGPDPSSWFFLKDTVISSRYDFTGLIVYTILRLSTNNLNISKILALMNVKYVLFNRDTNWEFIKENPWWLPPYSECDYINALNNQKGIHLEKSFAKLDFYINEYWKPMHIYVTTNSILIDGGLSEMSQISERDDFMPGNSVLILSDQISLKQITILPINIIFFQGKDLINLDQVLNLTYEKLSSISRDGRIIYVLEPQPLIVARYYSGWKGVISTSGQGDPDMLIFPSPNECPYINVFPPASPTSWSAYNSTLIYITTGSSTLTINSVSADGVQVSASAWWETDTSWRTGWPITIPSNQRAIIQVNQQANIITLQTDRGIIALQVLDGWKNPPIIKAPSEITTNIFIPKSGNYLLAVKVATGYGYGKLIMKIDDQDFIIDLNSQEQGPIFTYKYIGPINLTMGYHQFSTSGVDITIPVFEGWTNPINWTSTFTNQSYVARYYTGWKAVVRTDGSEPWDTLSFPTLDQCPYTFPRNFTCWNALNSTLVYLVTGDNPLRIDEVLVDGKITSDITGVWWETGWVGMATKPVIFPVVIPPHQRAIIQLNHKAKTVTLRINSPQIENILLYSLKNGENFIDADNILASPTDNISVTYEKINPTKYIVHINASKPFFLVFSESYHKDWKAYVSEPNWFITLFVRPISDDYHFIANGYANAWYINPNEIDKDGDGKFTITLYFWPQNLFYIGAIISLVTLALCTVYLFKDRARNLLSRAVRRKQLSIW